MSLITVTVDTREPLGDDMFGCITVGIANSRTPHPLTTRRYNVHLQYVIDDLRQQFTVMGLNMKLVVNGGMGQVVTIL